MLVSVMLICTINYFFTMKVLIYLCYIQFRNSCHLFIWKKIIKVLVKKTVLIFETLIKPLTKKEAKTIISYHKDLLADKASPLLQNPHIGSLFL